jgi:putative transposase
MDQDNIVSLRRPDDRAEDPLTEVLRHGARALLAQAIEAEVAGFLASHADLVDDAGRRRLVRNGFLPEREIQTGIGPIVVRQPRVRDRGPAAADTRIRFTSAILPRYLRRTRSLEELLPWLYLKGISSGDFAEALTALLGPDAPGLSAATISRLKEAWQGELQAWQGRDLAGKRYVYLWVDGVYFNARLDQARQCILVVIGADELGRKELVGLTDGYRESEQSWRELLGDLRHRGLEIGPELAIGDGNLGFWKALRQVYGAAREQRCWVHKTANVLNKLPKGVQAKAKQHLHAIWMAETRNAAEAAFDHFVDAYGAKYDKAVACLVNDRTALLAFYDFPAEHWKHVRTTDEIDKSFVSVPVSFRWLGGYGASAARRAPLNPAGEARRAIRRRRRCDACCPVWVAIAPRSADRRARPAWRSPSPDDVAS